MRPIPLFGQGVTSYSAVVTRQRRLNVMYDLRPDQDRAAVVAVGTPGSVLYATIPNAPVRGYHSVGETLYVVAGNGLYKINSAGAVLYCTDLPTASGYVGLADNSVQLFIVDGVGGYSYNINTGIKTTVTDVNFPNGATSVAFLNGYFIVNKPGTREFYVSNLLDGTVWTTLGLPTFGTKENTSDLLLEVDVLNGNLILWGQFSIEFWQDVGNALPAVPFQRVNGASQSWGIAATDSNVKVKNTQMFLGYNPDGNVQVVMLNGYTPVPVSTADIDYLISNFSRVDDAVAMAYTAYGHAVYQITFPTAGRTLAYDTTTQVWHDAQTGPSESATHYGRQSVAWLRGNYFSDATTGNVYRFDEDVFTDNGVAIPREICTRHIRADGNQIFLTQLMLDMAAGQGNEPVVFISVSRDNGNTFGPEKQRRLGAVGQYAKRIVFNRLGYGRDLVIKIRMVDNSRFIITGGSAVVEAADG